MSASSCTIKILINIVFLKYRSRVCPLVLSSIIALTSQRKGSVWLQITRQKHLELMVTLALVNHLDTIYKDSRGFGVNDIAQAQIQDTMQTTPMHVVNFVVGVEEVMRVYRVSLSFLTIQARPFTDICVGMGPTLHTWIAKLLIEVNSGHPLMRSRWPSDQINCETDRSSILMFSR